MQHVEARQKLCQVLSELREAEHSLCDAGQASADPVELMKINMELHIIDSYMSQILFAQAAEDDQNFDMAMNVLKQQASLLQQHEAHIREIIKDVGAAAHIVGVLAQAAATIATL